MTPTVVVMEGLLKTTTGRRLTTSPTVPLVEAPEVMSPPTRVATIITVSKFSAVVEAVVAPEATRTGATVDASRGEADLTTTGTSMSMVMAV